MQVAEIHHTDRIKPRRWLISITPVLLLFAIVAGFYWKLTLTNEYTWLESPDLANQVLPWYQFQAGEWHAGRFPMWDPYQWYGQPLIGQGQPGAAYPPNWLFFLTSLRNGWLRQSHLNWYFVLIHYLAALFCYWLCRDLGRSRPGSIVAGCAFALGGYIGTTDWPQMLNGAIWAPLVFLYQLRCLRGERVYASAAASGAFLGVAWLSGHHQVPIFLTLASAGVWLYGLLVRVYERRRTMAAGALFTVVFILASGLQTLPALEYGKAAKRWVGSSEPVGWNDKVPYTVHKTYSVTPDTLTGLILPGRSHNTDVFWGVVALSLAVLGAAALWRILEVRIFTIVAIAGLFTALGGYSLLHGLLYSMVPMVEKARSPSMAILVFHFASAVLVAYGFDTLLNPDSLWSRRVAIALAVFGLSVLALATALSATYKLAGDTRWILSGLVAVLMSAIISARRTGKLGESALAVAIIAVALADIGNGTSYSFVSTEEKDRTIYLKKIAQSADVAGFLQKQPRPLRVEVADADIPYNFGDWYGIEQSGGYLASITTNLVAHEFYFARFRDLLSVNYSVVNDPPRPGALREGAVEVYYSPASKLKVYFNPSAYPLVRSVHNIVTAGDGAITDLVRQDGLDLRTTAILREPPPEIARCDAGEDRFRITRRVPGSVDITADMKCAGLLVLADTYFPGWKAWVDEEPAHIYDAYGAIRAVAVPEGTHTVTFRYRPASVFAGAAMSASGLLAAMLLTLVRKPVRHIDAKPTVQSY